MDISVIIPTYNGSKFIKETIESVLSQTILPKEIIVVDDGSTDDTKNILKTYHNHVRYIYQKNAGSAAATNTGIKASSGDFLAFLDHDDIWHPKKMELQLALLLNNKHLKAAFCLFDIFSKENSIVINNSSNKGFLRSCLFIEKEFLAKIGFLDESLSVSESIEWVMRIVEKKKFGMVEEVLVNRRLHVGNTSLQNYSQYKELISILRQRIKGEYTSF